MPAGHAPSTLESGGPANMNWNPFRKFAAEKEGQDLIEYTLLLGFVAMICVAIFMAAGGATVSIWTLSNTHLARANTMAAGTGMADSAAPTTPPSGGDGGNGGGDHHGHGDHDWH